MLEKAYISITNIMDNLFHICEVVIHNSNAHGYFPAIVYYNDVTRQGVVWWVLILFT